MSYEIETRADTSTAKRLLRTNEKRTEVDTRSKLSTYWEPSKEMRFITYIKKN